MLPRPTARITFREMTTEDFEIMQQLLGDPRVMAYYPRAKSDDEVRRWLVAAYRLTKQSSYGEVQSLHRAVLRSLRLMQGASAGGKTSDIHWIESL